MGLDDAPRQCMVQAQVPGPVRHRRRGDIGGVELGRDLVEVMAKAVETREQHGVGDHVPQQEARHGLVLDTREACGLGCPLEQRVAARVGERVVRAGARSAGALLGAQVAELLEPLGLGVVLALGRRPVHAPLPGHPDQIVRAGPASADEGEHDVGERGEIG